MQLLLVLTPCIIELIAGVCDERVFGLIELAELAGDVALDWLDAEQGGPRPPEGEEPAVWA